MEPLQDGDPRTVGRFRILYRLGGGGMGRVFLGETPGGRKVAVKLMHAFYASDQGFRQRFAREVDAAKRVGGIFTASIVEADPNANPPWMVTEYIQGPSLEALIEDSGPLDPPALRDLGAALAEGLTEVHRCELVHRDLKPSNVIMAADGPRIIDFGIARALGAATLTTGGKAIGTPSYMSPEQFRGDRIGPESDVFSLGRLLVYAATGHAPFSGQEASTIMYAVLHKTPDLGLVSDPLRDIIGSCLAKDPADRPTPAHLLAAFRGMGEVPGPGRAVDAPAAPSARRPTWEGHRPAGAWPAQGPPDSPDSPDRRRFRVRRSAASRPVPASRQRPPGRLEPQLQVRPASGGWSLIVSDPSGRWLGSADRDGAIAVWDADSGLPVRSWSARVRIRSMAAAHDGMLAIGGDDGTVQIWDVETATVLDSFARHASRVQALAFDRTGTWLASGDRDGIIRLWESGSARALSTIREPAYQAAATLAIDWPHGLIAAGGGNGGLRVWDVNVPDAPELLAELPWAAVTTALAFDEAGDRLAAGGADGSVAVWDLERAAENSPDVRHVHSDKVLAVAWDDQQHGWISVGADGSVGPERDAGQPVIDRAPLRAAAVAPAARRGAVIDHSSGRMYVFRADAPGDTRPLAGTDLALTGISFARGDELLVMSGSDGTLQVWETRSPVLRTVRAVGCPITALCGSRDGMRLAACDEDGRVIIYSATGRSIVEQSARQGPDRVSAAAFRPDGARLVTAGDAVQVWNATDGTPGRALPDGTRRARDVCYHPAGRRLAAAGSDGVVMVWDGATLLCALTGHKGPVQAVAFGPADGQLVTAGDDETIRIWDLNRRDELRVLSGLGYRGTALAVNPADGTLAVGCGDGTVRLVTPPHWSDAPALVGHVHSITALSFTPDGQGLATASRDGTVRVWDLRTRSLETVLVPGVPGWAGVAALQDGSFRGYGAADGRIWYALGLTRQSLADGRSAANGALPTVTLPTRSGESDG